MKKPNVSILVPICNVEKFLDKCLQSLVGQTLKDIEIICINDGSSDSSLSIIKGFAALDNRIVIIDKVNTGYGDSMNKGLDIARGEYIGIVESDDYAEPEMFERLYGLAKKYNADVVKSNFDYYWENPEKKVYKNNLNISSIKKDLNCGKMKIFFGLPSIWSGIYKRKWLIQNDIWFLPTPGASYQDTSFNFKVGCVAQNIVLTNESFLNYRQDNLNSSVKNASLEKAYLLHKEWEEAERYMHEKNLNIYQICLNTIKLNGFIWNYSRISTNDRGLYFREISSWFNYGIQIDKNHIGSIMKYGGLYALRSNRKWLLDIILGIRNMIKHEK